MFRELGWKLVNVVQVGFFILWSVWWQSVSLWLRVVLRDTRVPLLMARWVWAPGIAAAIGCRLEPPDGLEGVDLSRPAIFVFNHQSTADIGVAFMSLPVPLRFVAKRELERVPFLGWYMAAMGMIFVDRGRSERAIASLERAGELIRAGAHIAAFPEGTRSADGRILPFKKGIFVVAIEAGVPVVPVAIEGSRHVWPRGSFRFRPGNVRVKLGQPIATAGLSYDDRDALRSEVHAALVALHREIGGAGAPSRHDDEPGLHAATA